MNRERLCWGIVFALGAAGLLYKATSTPAGVGVVYVAPAAPPADAPPDLAPRYLKTDRNDPRGEVSWVRTVGLWLSAFFTLSILSYLYRDNVFYKLTEAVIVGVSAAYLMVVGFWDSIVADLLVNLAPSVARGWAVPSTPPDRSADWLFLAPLVLGLLLFARFIPRGGWFAQLPVAFVVGTFAGLRLMLFLDADFISQIRNSLLPLVVLNGSGGWDWAQSLRNTGLVASLLTCLSYFFFSLEHRGVVGRSARVGVWVLMITFGASFAYTVMGRITLLTMRLEFLFRDWLQII